MVKLIRNILLTICVLLASVANCRSASVDLVWAIPINAVTSSIPVTGYNLQQSTNNGASFYHVLTTLGINSTNATVTVTQTNMNYCFRVNAYNPGGTSDFSNVACAMSPWPPTILTNPASMTAYIGGPSSFTVSAKGKQPFVYQWYKNGTIINNATNVTYTISTTQSSDAGSYTVVIANADGAITSAPAILTVYASLDSPLMIRILVRP